MRTAGNYELTGVDVRVFAWMRRRYCDSPPEGSDAFVKMARSLWRFYDDLRRDIAAAACVHEPIPYWHGVPLRDGDYLLPIDDDDIHGPEVGHIVEQALREKHVADVIWWRVAAIRWSRPVHYAPLCLWFGRDVPQTCGYALRYGFLKELPEIEKMLLRDDHVHVVSHCIRLGGKAVYIPRVGGLWSVTPASITAWKEFNGPPPWPTGREIIEVLRSNMPDWCRKFATEIGRILRRYAGYTRAKGAYPCQTSTPS